VIAFMANQLSGFKGQSLGEIGEFVQGNRVRHGASWLLVQMNASV
jgi:hypothetical protein